MKFCACIVLFAITLTPTLASAQSADLIASDFDGSGRVDFSDFLEFASAFGKASGQEGFDTKYDLDGSGIVDFGDFLIFASNFGDSTTEETGTFLYIADFFSDRVEVIDISTNLTIPTRAFTVPFPRGLAFGSQTDLIYVASSDTLFAFTDGGQQAYFIELTPVENPIAGTFSAPGGFKITVNDGETRAFVSEDGAGLIEVLDLANRVSLGQIPVGESPGELVLSADETELFVGRRGESIAVVDVASQTLIDSIQTGSLASTRIAISPDGTRIYAIASRPDEGHASGTAVKVLAIDPVSRSVVDSVQISRPADLGTQPVDISLSSGGGSLYVSVNRTDPGDLPDLTTLVQVGTLLTIDIATFTVVDEISELQLIFGFGITPDQETGYFSGIQDLNEPTFRIFVVDMLQGELLSQLPVSVNSGAEFLFTTAKQAVRSALTYLELSLF